MSTEGNLQDILDNGIEAARTGDNATAQKLLKHVLDEDPNNELALMWLASSVTSSADRRMYLQQVVRINPNNQRARQALTQLSTGRSENVAPVAPQVERDRAQARRQQAQASIEDKEGGVLSRLSAFEIILLLGLAVAIGAGFLIISNIQDNNQTQAVAVDSPTPVTPSNTPLPTDPVEVVVTRVPATLPATFTPTATATATSTPTPTLTPFPIEQFQAMLLERNPSETSPTLFRVDGRASNPQLLEGNVYGVAYGLSGQTIALVKEVTYEASEENPDGSTVTEIFVGSADNPADAQQVTFTRTASAHSPSFSPDANQLVFVSDFDGDDELWLLDINSRIVTQLTDNEFSDRDPDWSSDGTRIVFASDREFTRLYEIYMLEFVIQQDGAQRSPEDSPNIVTQITNDQGNSLQPKWSDNAQWIVYVNDADGDGDIFLMDKNGQRRRVMTINDGDAEDKNPSFTPDMRFISFISNREDEQFQVYLVSFDGREIMRLTNTENIAESIDYRPMLIFRLQSSG